MFLALWEYEVKPGSEKQYQRVYGPNGDWARLFGQDPRYGGTRLLSDPERPGFYVTLDFWESRQAFQAFLEQHPVEYASIEKIGEALTRSEKRLGWFDGGS